MPPATCWPWAPGLLHHKAGCPAAALVNCARPRPYCLPPRQPTPPPPPPAAHKSPPAFPSLPRASPTRLVALLDRRAFVYDLESLALLGTLDMPPNPRGLAALTRGGPGGDHPGAPCLLALPAGGGAVRVYDAAKPGGGVDALCELEAHKAAVVGQRGGEWGVGGAAGGEALAEQGGSCGSPRRQQQRVARAACVPDCGGGSTGQAGLGTAACSAGRRTRQAVCRAACGCVPRCRVASPRRAPALGSQRLLRCRVASPRIADGDGVG